MAIEAVDLVESAKVIPQFIKFNGAGWYAHVQNNESPIDSLVLGPVSSCDLALDKVAELCLDTGEARTTYEVSHFDENGLDDSDSWL
jgi:hypothetical protein